ncbi:MAG: glycosyltransferase family 4 protein, partial [Myxococcales bacterium]|nr:glycosyltransferase family 4 protein [Myxococcales bacterium]
MTSARDSAPEVREPAATRPRARVLYLHQYFVTRATAGGTRSYEMARRLVARGYQVHMITTDFGADAQPGAGWRVTDEDGICVHRVRVPYSNRAGFIGRLRAFLRYALASTVRVWALGGDVILATSPPLSIAIPALLGAWRHDIPMIFEVRDLWPEAPVAMGRLRNPALIAAARGLERLAYRRAAAIVGLSPPIAEGVARAGGDGAKVRVIPNAADIDLFDGTRDVAALRRALGLDGALTLGYFGTLGEANALGQVLDAAARLRARGEGGIRFLLVGDG